MTRRLVAVVILVLTHAALRAQGVGVVALV
jgi:hypothetical protein